MERERERGAIKERAVKVEGEEAARRDGQGDSEAGDETA